MDKVQAYVFETIPQANKQNGFFFTVVMVLFWLVYIAWLQNGGTRLIFKMFGFEEKFDKFDFSQKCKVVIICTSQLNVMIWLPLYSYSLLYANGKKGTNFLNDAEYMSTAYDFMIFYQVIQISEHIGETLYYLYCFGLPKKIGDHHVQMYMHHIIAIQGMLITNYVGGPIFAATFFSGVCEATNTPNFVRDLMANFLDMKESKLYFYNALVFLISFLWCRIVPQTYIVFTKINFSMPGWFGPSLIEGLNSTEIALVRFHQMNYFCFYLLNLYWFALLFRGVLASIGCISKPGKVKKSD